MLPGPCQPHNKGLEATLTAIHAEMILVLSARTSAEAAKVIAWWHSDWEWQAVGDSPKAAAQRIRAAARAAAH